MVFGKILMIFWNRFFKKSRIRSKNTLIILQKKLAQSLTERLDIYAQSMGPYIAQQVCRSIGSPSIAQPQPRKHTIFVHPHLLNRIAGLLPNQSQQKAAWSCPEQAELVQSSLTKDHVLAVLPTGSGKTLGFLAAAWLHSQDLFLVVIPLTALINDMARRLACTPISAGIYPQCDGISHQIVFVPAHFAATDAFCEWSNAANY